MMVKSLECCGGRATLAIGRFSLERPTTKQSGRFQMSATIINLIIQIIAGAIGGNAVGAASKDVNLGTAGNTIAGAIGGLGGGQLLTALIPMMAGVGNNVDIGALVSQAVGGGITGAILAAIVGVVKNKMMA
jgi:hypothetical protein